ncbi:GH116 family glycosyl hydrolase [Kribbella sp. NPDC049174]|uniref:GH116 family glycosyl hydrolase n=1 Tax=Kribbella sp. NPDC049174 TaxID=3364112 RepID=UPI0037118CC0
MHYTGDKLTHFALPLGGLGTGTVALAGNGALRQWQLHNIGNHEGHVPDSFFALRLSQVEPPMDEIRLLQGPLREPSNTPLVTDDAVPAGEKRLHELLRPVGEATVSAVYPRARVDYETDLPLDLSMEVFNPLVPADAAASSQPVVAFTFTLQNTGEFALHGLLAGALQNSVGWDGVTPIDGVSCALYGGNTNRVRQSEQWTSLVMENTALAADHPGAGQLVLSTESTIPLSYPQWSTPEQFVTYLAGRPTRRPFPADGPSAPGTTWNGGLAAPFRLEPGETVQLRFLIAWHFPNRFVDFQQFGPRRDYGHSRFWLGNAYTRRTPDAVAVTESFIARWPELQAHTTAWADAFESSSLPGEAGSRLAALVADVRSPTVFQTAGDTVLGFEGVLGASTGMWGGRYGGSCPLNCTHVWNYEQTLSRLFPSLERNMRDTEYDVMQAPEGYIPHRVIAPTYHRQLWDVVIGGPEEPALDGMLGNVLKTYREVRQGAGLEWLTQRWPNVQRLLTHIRTKWDSDNTGVLRGIQPSTHDIDLCGVNTFMGTLWLAALRAAEEMALLLGEDGKDYRMLFEAGSKAYDELLFTGEYYRQVLSPDEKPDFQWGDGCLADQLIGQWWAHQLDLGYILPADHVKTALRNVVRHNLRKGFEGFDHPYRVFADGNDTGLLMCTWPYGGRPDIPTRYCDEVWTGSEYQVAAHCLYEGLVDEGFQILQGLWDRYDGSRRNPFNPIECGDHYIRNAAGWTVLEALAGFRYDALSGTLTFAPLDVARSDGVWQLPFVAGTGWGVATSTPDSITLTCHAGHFDLQAVHVDGTALPADNTVVVPGKPLVIERP